MADAELEKLLAPLDGADAAARTAAAKSLADLGPDALPAITRKLAELRKTPAASVTAALKGVKVADGGDLCDALVKAGKTDGPGGKAALQTAALVRGLAHVATPPPSVSS